jgi:hypothetical protein
MRALARRLALSSADPRVGQAPQVVARILARRGLAGGHVPRIYWWIKGGDSVACRRSWIGRVGGVWGQGRFCSALRVLVVAASFMFRLRHVGTSLML